VSASISYKLKNSLQGALAGGGDPATSPLYVFGPFLSLIVGAGVASVTFGASVWMAVFTVVAVSAMYRYVMIWVIDGSGGSGLTEEEFGGWAVKTNAAITVIEYTLTFLVSIAALVTFIADRFPGLNSQLFSIDLRVIAAVFFTLLVGFLVNRGPTLSARFFGPATAAVLVLLWLMIFSVIYQRGLQLPDLNLKAFSGEYVHFTLGGYARILALMTGIEIFANLVAAYDGTAREKSRKAFGSLVIIMGTTALTMVIVGPAILDLSDPANPHVSVFTQTMDAILPAPLAYLGSLIGIAVLLSAAAASAQGIQNLSLGLRNRHYIPGYWGIRNRFDVPTFPVWFQVVVVVSCFLIFGTSEETYLALYAAGVFILLSMTGWATSKRLMRGLKSGPLFKEVVAFLLTLFASLLSTLATLIIFEERFFEGAWLYFILVPAHFICFGYFRKRLGEPTGVQDRLKFILESSPLNPVRRMVPMTVYTLKKIMVPLDGTENAESSLPSAVKLSKEYGASITLVTVVNDNSAGMTASQAEVYLGDVARQIAQPGKEVTIQVVNGDPAKKIASHSIEAGYDLVVMTTVGKTPAERLLTSPVTYGVMFETTPPLLLVRPTDDWRCRRSDFRRILVPLDGSPVSEQCIPFARALALRFHSEVWLLSVPEEDGNTELKAVLENYLTEMAEQYAPLGIPVHTEVSGSGPARTILEFAGRQGIDLIILTSHGSGGVERQDFVKLGSSADKVISEAPCPVFFVSSTQIKNIRLPKSIRLRKKRQNRYNPRD
jgi:nucleotide-binding universal stress UspA family protein